MLGQTCSLVAFVNMRSLFAIEQTLTALKGLPAVLIQIRIQDVSSSLRSVTGAPLHFHPPGQRPTVLCISAWSDCQ